MNDQSCSVEGSTPRGNLHRPHSQHTSRASVPEVDTGCPTTYPSTGDEIFDFLRSLPEFSDVPEGGLRQLAFSCGFVTLQPGAVVHSEGDDAALHGFIVVSGCLAMFKTSITGKNLIVELLRDGDTFGLLIMLARKRPVAVLSAKALQRSKILRVPTDSFLHMLTSYPLVFEEFTAHLLVCLESSHRLARGLAHDKVEVRIAAILSSLALKFSRPRKSDGPYTIYFTRQQIADLAGTTPETAIRVTRAMQADGVIDLARPGIIKILDVKALQGFLEA